MGLGQLFLNLWSPEKLSGSMAKKHLHRGQFIHHLYAVRLLGTCAHTYTSNSVLAQL